MRGRLAAVVALAFALAGCSDPADTEVPSIEVFGPYVGTEADSFVATLKAFEDRTGVDVRYVGSAAFAAELRTRVNDADPPDVAIVPQPGLVAELADSGAVGGLDASVDEAVAEWIPSAVQQLGVVDGRQLGVPYRIFVKSLVWYSPAVFAENGWQIPSTLDELQALTEDIARGELAPWCFGIEAFGSTGWVATDWIEEMLLRLAGEDAYDDWVDGTLAFDSPELAAAFTAVEQLLLEPGHVLGNTPGIVRTPVRDAILPLVEPEPRCAMHRNGNFAESWLPSGTTVGPDGDADVFVLPPAQEDERAPLLTAVELAVPMTEDPIAQQLLAYLASPEGGRAWAEAGGYVGGRRGEARYLEPLGATVSELLRGADVVRADGSDQMPPDFGSGTFWDLATRWVGGRIDTGRVLTALDQARSMP